METQTMEKIIQMLLFQDHHYHLCYELWDELTFIKS